jgi:hypothetical protein
MEQRLPLLRIRLILVSHVCFLSSLHTEPCILLAAKTPAKLTTKFNYGRSGNRSSTFSSPAALPSSPSPMVTAPAQATEEDNAADDDDAEIEEPTLEAEAPPAKKRKRQVNKPAAAQAAQA